VRAGLAEAFGYSITDARDWTDATKTPETANLRQIYMMNRGLAIPAPAGHPQGKLVIMLPRIQQRLLFSISYDCAKRHHGSFS
jgi:hypothetical protein